MSKKRYGDDRHKYSHKCGTLKVKTKRSKIFTFWTIRTFKTVTF